MISSTGTLKVMELIERLENEGHLIDVYSKAWMTTKNKYEFTAEDYQWLTERYGRQFDSHLLVVYLVDQDYDTFQDFVDVYPILRKALIDNLYQPTFLFINLETQQILCAGLGKRSSLFLFDAKTNESLIQGEKFYDEYLRRFTNLDHQNVIHDLIDALERIGQSYQEFDQIPGSLEQVEFLLSSATHPQEFYTFKNDSCRYTLEQLQEFEMDYKDILDQQDEWVEIIQKYFPQYKAHHQKMIALLTE